MKLQRNIETWVKQGLITQDQGSAILAFEESIPQRSWAMYGVVGIGITAIMAGFISLIAANWDNLSTPVKIGGYFLVQIGLGLAFLRYAERPSIAREIFLTLFGLFFLAGIGLVGQIFHLQSDGWSAFLFWCALSLPAALLAHSKMLPELWHVALGTAVLIWVSSRTSVILTPALLALVPAYFVQAYGFLRVGDKTLPEHFRRAAQRWSFLALAAVSALAHGLWYAANESSYLQKEGLWPYGVLLLATCLPIGALCLSTPRSDPRVRLFGSAAILLLTFFIAAPRVFGLTHELLACLIFVAIWSCVAAAAVFADRKRLFDVATLVIALRFIVVYFQVFASLAATGVGLIVSGGVILAVAVTWQKLRKKALSTFSSRRAA